ncbi:MAG: addiction module HigA family antidote [Ascidiaceihabitans sp.]|jgi:addiction module HigA family antidote
MLRDFAPGELLREDLPPALNKPEAEVVRLLGVSLHQLNDLLGELKPIDQKMARQLSKIFENGSDFWMKMQRTHDAWHLSRDFNSPDAS